MCEIDFDGTCSVWRENTRKARKEHRCSCCGGTIRVGKTYLDHFSVYEGDAARQFRADPQRLHPLS